MKNPGHLVDQIADTHQVGFGRPGRAGNWSQRGQRGHAKPFGPPPQQRSVVSMREDPRGMDTHPTRISSAKKGVRFNSAGHFIEGDGFASKRPAGGPRFRHLCVLHGPDKLKVRKPTGTSSVGIWRLTRDCRSSTVFVPVGPARFSLHGQEPLERERFGPNSRRRTGPCSPPSKLPRFSNQPSTSHTADFTSMCANSASATCSELA